MATLTVGQVDRTGLLQSLAAAAEAGDEFANDGKTALIVANANGAATRTVTFAITKTVDGVTPAGKAVTLALSTTRIIGPFPPEIYNDSDGMVQVTYDDHTDVTVQAVRL